jgi:hypothetical protein
VGLRKNSEPEIVALNETRARNRRKCRYTSLRSVTRLCRSHKAMLHEHSRVSGAYTPLALGQRVWTRNETSGSPRRSCSKFHFSTSDSPA